MIRALYDWTLNLARHPRAPIALSAVSFTESSFFPIPPDIMLIPMVIAEKAKAWFYAAICTVSSVAGAIFGYLIGLLLFEAIGRPVLAFYGYAEKFTAFAEQYNEWGALIVLIAGVTPIPFKVVTIASGTVGMNLLVFIAASIVARGARFFIVAGLLYFFGPPIRAFIEKHLSLVFTLFCVLLVGGFVVIRYLI